MPVILMDLLGTDIFTTLHTLILFRTKSGHTVTVLTKKKIYRLLYIYHILLRVVFSDRMFSVRCADRAS